MTYMWGQDIGEMLNAREDLIGMDIGAAFMAVFDAIDPLPIVAPNCVVWSD